MQKNWLQWQALACLLLQASCAPPAGPATPPATTTSTAPATTPASDPNSPIISPFLQSVLRDAAPDPIAALPVQAPPLRLAGTWSGGVLRRLGALALRAQAESSEGGESNDLLASSYQFIWWAPPVMALAGGQAELRQRLTDTADAAELATLCEKARQTDDYSDRIGCGQRAAKALAYAELRLATGDQPAAEALYRQATAAMPIGGATKCNHDLEGYPDAVDSDCVWFLQLRAAYQGLTGRADDYVGTMQTAISLPPKTRQWDRTELPNDETGDWVYRMLRVTGKLRAFGRVADMMTTEKLLSIWDVTDQLFEEIDRQAVAPGGHANAANLLAIASRLSTRPIGTFPDNRQPLRLALDCRAAEVRALSPGGTGPVAAMLPEMVDRYVATDGEYFAVNLCLYQLTTRLNLGELRARVLAHAQRSRQKSIAHSEQYARDYTGDYQAQVDHTAEMSHIIARPWLPFLADDAALRTAILAALDKSKSAPMKSLDYRNLMELVLWVDMQQNG